MIVDQSFLSNEQNLSGNRHLAVQWLGSCCGSTNEDIVMMVLMRIMLHGCASMKVIEEGMNIIILHKILWL